MPVLNAACSHPLYADGAEDRLARCLVQPHFLILSTNPHEADGVENAFIVFVASSPSGLTNPDEPDGVGWPQAGWEGDRA